MAKRYRPVLRDQPFLLPPDMREWLPEGHAVWLVIGAVPYLDTSVFHARRRTGGAGAAGYDPDMLVTLLIWAYAHGVTSSRKIEAACWQDVAFRVICAGDVPDHVTVARFRAAFPGAAQALFTEVLVLCAKLGMGKLGTVALDGMKIAANASKDANRTEATLRKLAAAEASRAAAAHAEADAAEDALFGAGNRGGDVPAEVACPATRAGRIAAALADLEAERLAAQAEQDAQAREYLARGAGAPGAPPKSAAVQAAGERLDRARAARVAQLAELQRRGRAGNGDVEGYCKVKAARQALEKAGARQAAAEARAAAAPGPVRNITDPDSRLMPTRNGFLQGYNAQNVPSEDGLIIATELTQDTTDTEWFEPMLARAEDAAALITAHQPPPPAPGTPASQDSDGTPDSDTSQDHPDSDTSQDHPDSDTSQNSDGTGIGLFLSDAGYLSRRNLTIAGPDRLIAVGKHRDLEKTARQATTTRGPGDPGERDGDPIAAMAARLATPDGITAYRKRGHIAETPHGQIKHNMGIRRLATRGKPRASAEWAFITTVHNLLKAITTGHLTPATLTALAS